MIVKFRTTALAKAYESRKDRQRAWGEKTAKLFVRRIETLIAATNAQDLRTNPVLKFHALVGPMAGLHALWIDAVWRMVLRFEDAAQTIVTVEEVSKHYGGTST